MTIEARLILNKEPGDHIACLNIGETVLEGFGENTAEAIRALADEYQAAEDRGEV